MTSVLGSGRASGGPSGQLKCKPKRRRRRRSKRKGKGDLWVFALFVCLFGCLFLPPAPRGHAGHCLGMEPTGPDGALPGGTRPKGGGLHIPLAPHSLFGAVGGSLRCVSPGVPLWRGRKRRRAPQLQAGDEPHTAPFWLFPLFFVIKVRQVLLFWGPFRFPKQTFVRKALIVMSMKSKATGCHCKQGMCPR